ARLRSLGYNLVGDNSGCVFNPANGDQFGTSTQPLDPLLDSLEDNGGPTLTHALLKGSPAIDAGNPFRCADRVGDTLTTDQRGAPRAVDGSDTGRAICDIGAYEFEANVPTPTPAATLTRTATPVRTPTP
ncbi:MAG: choice-of-anchor Q domain-containing protein, partial [Anaerolineales bacterium]